MNDLLIILEKRLEKRNKNLPPETITLEKLISLLKQVQQPASVEILHPTNIAINY